GHPPPDHRRRPGVGLRRAGGHLAVARRAARDRQRVRRRPRPPRLASQGRPGVRGRLRRRPAGPAGRRPAARAGPAGAGGGVAAGGTALYAFGQRSSADAARNNANSREIALIADQLRGQDPALAAQLSVASYATARTPQATAAVLESSGAPAAERILDTSGLV